ncbi:MAG: aminoacyl-tRNA hydrolase [Deltaproteobacteria bacterium]|jgi:PTH1 family peptidyl-tRNA hydrolase|nr:aminoacyl-tRNA hydrolase [Deltaproteobacteria bacterium]
MDHANCIAGLGNPGKEYRDTRHNLGFVLIDALLEECGRMGQVERLSGGKFQCELWRCRMPGANVWHLVAKPTTYMNLSGEALQALLHWHRMDAGRLLVAHDELDFEPGDVRFKFGGGAAGHKGLASIIQQLGTQDFYRLRIGVGRVAGLDAARHVLAPPTSEERPLLEKAIRSALKGIMLFAEQGPAAAMNFLHTAE